MSFSIFNFQFSTVNAQRYPERRATREGTRLYERGDFAGAEAAYRRALEMNPALREGLFNLSGALWRQAQASVAEAQQAQNGAAQSQAGATAGQPETPTEEQQPAIQRLMQEASEGWMAVAVDSLAPPSVASAAGYNAGNVALAAQQLDAAIEAYKHALRLRPDDTEAKFNLAYAQALKREQEENDEGGGGQQNDPQNDPQNGEGQNDPQEGDPQEGNGDRQNGDGNPQNGEGQNDSQEGKGQNDPKNGEGNPQNGQGRPQIDPRAAEQMLDAMQAAENDTREKLDAREVQTGARSGKNW
ncbi:MAG: tetratricopeptide repeat protein [Alistipes sp.]|nr:tetratricopeptide repeat protein [Alistipes sp.]